MTTASRPARLTTAFALLLLSAGASVAQVQVYRYVDSDGHIVYSDKPPPPSARDAQAKRIGGNTIETSEISYAVQQAQERFPVTLYTFACGVVCDTAQGILNKRGVPHTVVDVSQGEGAEKLKRLSGSLDAPTVQVGDNFTTGFNEAKWQTMLTDAGYPKTPPPRTNPVGRPAPIAAAPSTTSQSVAAPAAPAAKGTYPQQ